MEQPPTKTVFALPTFVQHPQPPVLTVKNFDAVQPCPEYYDEQEQKIVVADYRKYSLGGVYDFSRCGITEMRGMVTGITPLHDVNDSLRKRQRMRGRWQATLAVAPARSMIRCPPDTPRAGYCVPVYGIDGTLYCRETGRTADQGHKRKRSALF